MTENWISLREFARRRGVSLQAVQKAIASGRVKAVRRDDKGRLTGIDVVVGELEWNGNTDVDQAARAGAPLLAETSAPDPAQRELEAPAASNADAPSAQGEEKTNYLDARARSEDFRAKHAELDYQKALGLLISVEEQQRVSARRYMMVRDKFLNIPDRLATILAAERDPARIHSTITAELKRVLNELADDAEAETAAGVAERVAA